MSIGTPSNYALPATATATAAVAAVPSTLPNSHSQPVLSAANSMLHNQSTLPISTSGILNSSTGTSQHTTQSRTHNNSTTYNVLDITTQQQQYIRLIDQLYGNNTDKINSELIGMTYGVFITSICSDMNYSIAEINTELYTVGNNIGMRIIDEFLAKTQSTVGYRCDTFYDCMFVVAKLAFKYYLGITADIIQYNIQHNNNNQQQNNNHQSTSNNIKASCILQFAHCPLYTFVDLPDTINELQYGAILCGMITGALQQLNINVQCKATKHEFVSDSINEIQIDLIDIVQDNHNIDDDT